MRPPETPLSLCHFNERQQRLDKLRSRYKQGRVGLIVDLMGNASLNTETTNKERSWERLLSSPMALISPRRQELAFRS